MILKEATVGGKIFLDWMESEKALDESERVAFNYGPISNKVKIRLLHQTVNERGIPNGADVCKAAIDDLGLKVVNLKAADGSELDTIQKMLAYHDKDLTLAYIIEMVGSIIWAKQTGEEVGLKN
jgi:hypothetical protein